MQLTRFSGPRHGHVYRAHQMLSECHHTTRNRFGSSDHAAREDTDQCQRPRPAKGVIHEFRPNNFEKIPIPPPYRCYHSFR